MSQTPNTPPVSLLDQDLRTQFRNEVQLATQTAFHNLVESVERTKLPEHVFRQNFLGYFTGQTKSAPQNNLDAQWIGIAGAPTAEVDVVSEAGETLFTVPALLNTSGLEILRSRHRTRGISDMVSDFNDEAPGLPTVARSKLYRALSEKSKEIITDNPSSRRDQDNWAKIATFYGLAPQEAAKGEAGKTAEDDPLQYE